jgi:hypothetical protein
MQGRLRTADHRPPTTDVRQFSGLPIPSDDHSSQEVSDQTGNLGPVGLESEVAGVEKVYLRVGQVALIGARSVGAEDLVVLSPSDQRGRLVLAEVLLEVRVSREVELVVSEQL